MRWQLLLSAGGALLVAVAAVEGANAAGPPARELAPLGNAAATRQDVLTGDAERTGAGRNRQRLALDYKDAAEGDWLSRRRRRFLS